MKKYHYVVLVLSLIFMLLMSLLYFNPDKDDFIEWLTNKVMLEEAGIEDIDDLDQPERYVFSLSEEYFRYRLRSMVRIRNYHLFSIYYVRNREYIGVAGIFFEIINLNESLFERWKESR